MLSRTADHLYWMARYMERAENTARMLDAGHRISLMRPSSKAELKPWASLLAIMGLESAFAARYTSLDTRTVMTFMLFDTGNPSSVYNCFRNARENAHAVRGTLTSELWEATNATWLELQDLAAQGGERAPSEIFDWVKYRSHLSRGVALGTMLQDDSLRFMRLGTFLERADNTARILDAKFRTMPADTPLATPASDYYSWSALLHSVSAFEVYRKVYSNLIAPLKVAELLILRVNMPRSLARCMQEVYANLQVVANRRSAETERRAGELEAELRFGRIEMLVERGLHSYLTVFLERIGDLGKRIAEDFLVPVSR